MKLHKVKFLLDGLFTGIDCPHAALEHLSRACHKRCLVLNQVLALNSTHGSIKKHIWFVMFSLHTVTKVWLQAGLDSRESK